MLSDSRIARIIQPNFHQSGAALPFGRGIGCDKREKALKQKITDFSRLIFPRIVPPISPVPRPRIVSGCSSGADSSLDNKHLFGRTALLPQRMKLHCIQLRASFRELLFGKTRHGQIHVVAAEQQMLADCDALQLKLAAPVQ